MMKRLLIVAAVAALTALAFAQAQSPMTNGGSGPTLPANCVLGSTFAKTGASAALHICSTQDVWTEIPTSGGSIPSGAILLVTSGGCPSGFTEESALNGKTLIGTLVANGDIGTTGGSDTITQVLNHTHTANVTDPGHTHVQGVNSTATGPNSGYTADTSTNNRVDSSYSTSSGTTGITVATDNPAGGAASTDNRSAFTKVIFCRKD